MFPAVGESLGSSVFWSLWVVVGSSPLPSLEVFSSVVVVVVVSSPLPWSEVFSSVVVVVGSSLLPSLEAFPSVEPIPSNFKEVKGTFFSWSLTFNPIRPHFFKAQRNALTIVHLDNDISARHGLTWNINAVQKIKKLSESPATVPIVAKLCKIDSKKREIDQKEVQPVTPHLGQFTL